jgi:hypothetical protein
MKETKFDCIIRLLEENKALTLKQSLRISKLERKVKQHHYRVTLIVMLFFVIILGILIIWMG